jgi:1-deoxy-D-xylulose-5-phosphate synthase
LRPQLSVIRRYVNFAALFGKSVILEELGLKYFGPSDGHDTATLIKTFEFLKNQERHVLLDVLTQKGKGFEAGIA